MDKPTQQSIDSAPYMTHWFKPSLLIKLLWHVILSDIFGRFADRRLIHAALDSATPKEIMERADIREFVNPDDKNSEVWIDYVSDLGDGFESTYAIAYSLAQSTLKIDGEELPRGRILVMGGDEVYPNASADDYHRRTLDPYEWASPREPNKKEINYLLYAIPGNHDWYDGLNIFLTLFCNTRPNRIGGWQTRQRRSYFAVRLTDDWWLWAIDIQLTHDVDDPQVSYFEEIVETMPQGSNIILCSAEPGWYRAINKDDPSFKPLHYVAWIAQRANKDFKILAALSGDTHHYSRYSSDHIGTQFITSGGGGAFLHPTHQLKEKMTAEWLTAKVTWSLRTDPGQDHAPSKTWACYPSRGRSRLLLLWNLLFPFFNFGLSFLIGLIYLLAAVSATRWGLEGYGWIAVVLTALLAGYTLKQEGRTWKVIFAIPHAAMHVGVIYGLSVIFDWLNGHLGLSGYWQSLTFAAEMLTIGALTGGFVFGVYLIFTCLLAGMSDNDAFSAMRLNTYKHFLRIRIEGDHLTVYAIGIDHVPKRQGWQVNPKIDDEPLASQVVPKQPLKYRLIEKIVVHAKNVRPIAQAAPPQTLPPRGKH